MQAKIENIGTNNNYLDLDTTFFLTAGITAIISLFIIYQYFIKHPIRKIEGECKWGSVLGEGAFGVVEKYNLNGKFVAIKIPKDGVTCTMQKKEIEQLERVGKHKSVVEFHKLLTIDDKPSIMMEYMEGGNLRNLLDQRWWNSPNWKKKLKLSIQITEGLSHLHYHRIGRFSYGTLIHQDLKSDNVLLDGTHENAKIADFGVSRYYYKVKVPLINKTVYQNVPDNSPGGTFLYMAPEVFQNFIEKKCDYDAKADIFSLGILFWEIATTQQPNRTIKEITKGEFNLFTNDQNNSCRFFKPVIKKCVNIKPNERPKAEEVLEDLKKLEIIAKKEDEKCLIM